MKPRTPVGMSPAVSRRTSATPSANTPLPAADPAQKTWEVHPASGVPAPVIRANMISLRLSFQGGVKVTFFEQG